MIANKPSVGFCVMSALQWIEFSTYTFFLTGSRFFGTFTDKSDYDFFVQDSQEVRDELEKFGFKLDCKSYNEDPNFTRVYKKDNVHVQCVKCAKSKNWVQYILTHTFLILKPSKEHARILWRNAMRLYISGMSGKFNGSKLQDKPQTFKDADDFLPF